MVDSMRKTSVQVQRSKSNELGHSERTDHGPVADRADRIARRDVNEDDDDNDVWSIRC